MYKIENPLDKAMTGMDQASSSYGSMTKDIPANRDPGPSAFGTLNAGVSGAKAGEYIGGLLAPASLVPAGVGTTAGMGAGVGLMSAGVPAAVASTMGSIAPAAAAAGPPGWAIGAALGIGAYLFS
ncbi:MAG: hypothetical protein H8E41_10060 [Desulfobulbaceae bacterium]|uniref:Uncharacterized protein n=1 Tax=Candidatus Desulfobia pelagia TaxID=2841692 RepID=A0A8J6NFY8_9BACT|nr:hypothetical protein [Candidatus Desulfobia pelagia]